MAGNVGVGIGFGLRCSRQQKERNRTCELECRFSGSSMKSWYCSFDDFLVTAEGASPRSEEGRTWRNTERSGRSYRNQEYAS